MVLVYVRVAHSHCRFFAFATLILRFNVFSFEGMLATAHESTVEKINGQLIQLMSRFSSTKGNFLSSTL